MLAGLAAAAAIEARAARSVRDALGAEDLTFSSVEADGLRLRLSGDAPSEALRFRALTVAGQILDPARVIDAMTVPGGEGPAPPRFAVEMLRGRDRVSLIGLVPADTDREALQRRIANVTGDKVADFLQVADHPTPEAWDEALVFAAQAVGTLARSKVSAEPGQVTVVAAAATPEDRDHALKALRQAEPEGVAVDLTVSAPRPVIAPYPLRFEGGEDARLIACAAATREDAEVIEAAARAAGAEAPSCRIGLGAPSPRWPEGAAQAIEAVAALGEGVVTIVDADVTLVAGSDASTEAFDTAAGALQGALPPAFSLHMVPPDTTATPGDAAFSADLADGSVVLSGQLPDERALHAVESLARARFPGAEVEMAARVADDLPEGWPLRAMAGIEALAVLQEGAVEIGEAHVALSGRSADDTAEARAAGLLSRALGGGEELRLDVAHDPALAPQVVEATPQDCIARIHTAHEARKITFAPGSNDIEPAGLATLSEIAGILAECPEMSIEVAGHTDSQGGEEMNHDLSLARAEAVVEALASRRAPVSGLRAEGYGETRPVADNEVAEGREANRRIEFVLMRPGATVVSRGRSIDQVEAARRSMRDAVRAAEGSE